MRSVMMDLRVQNRIEELERYLVDELKLSEMAALRRSRRIREFIHTLQNPADYAPCRFRAWREAGYRCVAFEGWVFAYETFDDGVIVRDMAHGKSLDAAASTI